METSFALLDLCARNSPVTAEFPTQRPMTRSFDVFCDRHLNNGRVNNRDAADLRRHSAHYDVTVVCQHLITHHATFKQRRRKYIKLECGTWYHHPRRLQCVLSRNLRIFKVATWHYRCRHNLKINVDLWPAISKSVIHWDHLLACIT